MKVRTKMVKNRKNIKCIVGPDEIVGRRREYHIFRKKVNWLTYHSFKRDVVNDFSLIFNSLSPE